MVKIANIVFINGSPRTQNSSKIIEYAKSQTENNCSVIHVAGKQINFCTACNYCKKEKNCIQKDDMNDINKKLDRADAIVFVSPVYFGSMTGQMKTLIDRTVPLRRNNMKLRDKLGAVLAVGGSRNGGQELTIIDIMAAMHIHGMIVVGDDSHFGGTAHEPFEEDEFGKTSVKTTMQKLNRLLKCQQYT
ncbi:MAG: Iron-sulfur flavoprotein [Candidatus Woesearchaeota archaeon]|nr:Iron-sulfur flavoprotein [Candidatus Woesearchaeota archaeon]